MAAPMFGCIIPGRLPIFDSQQVSETQIVYQIPQCNSVNHVVLFLTGSQPIPDGYGVAIFLCWPKPQPAWYLLGFMSNAKPSVIFKIAKPKEGAVQSLMSGWQTSHNQSDDTSAQIGIAIEPVTELSQKTPIQQSTASTVSSFVEFTQKMLTHVFNYCTSFAVAQSEMRPQPNETFVPMSSLKKWYETFQRRMSLDPNFWKDL